MKFSIPRKMAAPPAIPPTPVSALEFREITDDAPRDIKELLVRKEAVHPFAPDDKIADLSTHRLAPWADGGTIHDKHCYALFEPGAKTPKVAVYVKLLRIEPDADGNIPSSKLPGNIMEILGAPVKPIEAPNTAIFYTITNLSAGVKGPETKADKKAKKAAVTRGEGGKSPAEHLIGCVAKQLSQAYGIRAFSTLSPLRTGAGERADGFAQWLQARMLSPVSREKPAILTHEERAQLRTHAEAGVDMSDYEALQSLIAKQAQLPVETKQFLTTLMKDLGTYYLAHEKSKQSGVLPLDKVANFHIGNGAEIANIHWLPGKQSTLSDSIGAAGLMVNYRYYPEQLPIRKLRFAERAIVRQSPEMAERYAQRMQPLSWPHNMVETTSIELQDKVKLTEHHAQGGAIGGGIL